MKRIKQVLALALTLILALSLAPATAKADPPPSGCIGGRNHDWILMSDSATCTTSGTKKYKCSLCNISFFESSPAKGHDWRMEEYESSSCTQDGYVKYKCTRCSETYEETIPGGHDWTVWYLEGEQNREPTCTEPGVMTRHCDRCWTTEVVTIPALGHQWDGGEIISSSEGVLAARRIRYTCQRCGYQFTKTESSIDELFGMLRTPTKPKDSKLIVTRQPEDGVITRDSGETHTMTVAVEGGEEPYSYEWHRVDKTEDKDSQMAHYVTSHHREELAEVIAAYQEERQQALGLAGKLTGRGEMASKEPAGTTEQLDPSKYFDPHDHNLGKSDEPSFTADRGDSEYYCIIRDNAGNWTVTDSAELRYRLRIVEEPQNLDGKEGGEFTIRVADGVKPYSYQWWVDDNWGDGQPWKIEGANSPVLPLEERLYGRMIYCEVTDQAGDSVQSRRVYAYVGEGFALLDCTSATEIGPGETLLLEVRFQGGEAPYSASWTKDDVLVEEQTSDAAEGPVFTLEISGPGWYCCTGRDGTGAEIPVYIHVEGKQLNILRQPQGGDLDESGVFVTDMEMENGEEPFTYTVRAYGVEPKVYSGQGKTPSFEITEPGSYWVYAEDSKGQWAESDYFTVTDGAMRVVWTSGPYTQVYPYENCILVVDVEGGKPPYSYRWIWDGPLTDQQERWDDQEENYLIVDKPGWYFCYVTDADDHTLNVPGIRINYEGDEPFIIDQPVTTVTKYDGPAPVLHCRAVSGTGDNKGLQYVWKVKTDTGWTKVGDSPDYKVPNTGLGKSYVCIVTDSYTGKSSTSDEVMAYDELACAETETVNGGRLSRWLFVGGVGPYEVTVSCYDPNAKKNEDVYKVVKTYTVDSLGWLEYPHSASTTCAYTMEIRDSLYNTVSEMAPVKGR